ncbi:MAG TPA: CmpA/NrtA family ABC transporter substrate-binding protein [Verrucomicrobiae bacterium]|nr:CmpA/NrtA family ABC transporter substrate-binding protein [Verrucomicrobiae bacterium]
MRFAKHKLKTLGGGGRGWLNIGFVPTIDCALLVAAQELGLFTRHGLSVRLSREVGWATIREKLLHEELDAAGAHASMAFSIYCGLSVVRRACLTGLLLGLHGSAITLSSQLWDAGVRDAASLARVVRERGPGTLNFGVVLQYSSQNYHLRSWLRAGGIDPDRDIRITVVPSVLVYESFREGYLDGYCVAEPWNTAAVANKNGWIAAITSEIEPPMPEKVLLVLQDFAEKRAEEHLRLIAALIEASQFCDQPENRPELARMLSQSRYFDVSEELLRKALVGPLDAGHGRQFDGKFVVFDSLQIGAPTRAMGRRTFDLVRTLGPGETNPALHTDVIGKVFREDIFEQAKQLYLSSRNPGPSTAAAAQPSSPAPATTSSLVTALRESRSAFSALRFSRA